MIIHLGLLKNFPAADPLLVEHFIQIDWESTNYSFLLIDSPSYVQACCVIGNRRYEILYVSATDGK